MVAAGKLDVVRLAARAVAQLLETKPCHTGADAQRLDRAALDFLHARYPQAPLWAAGFSFGSWVALEAGAADPRVSTLIAIAPPVARDGYWFPNTLASEKPKFLIQGAMDELCPVKSLWAFYARLHEPKEIVLIDGANHLFEGQTEEVGEALEGLLGDTE